MAANDNQEQWVKIQHKTFMNWCNFCFLSAGVDIKLTNLETDFESGVNLIKLVEVLTGESLAPYNEKPRMRIHKAVNINVALKKIKDSGVIVTQGAEDVIDGNLKLILGLVWMMINRFQINTSGGGGKMSAKENILTWVKEYLKDYPIDLRDFPRCFQDGNIFSYLVHRGHPQLIDIEKLPNKEPLDKLDHAFTQAERFGVPKLLSPEDMLVSRPDEQSVLTYLSVFRAKVESEEPSDVLLPVVQEQLQDIKDIKEDWEKWKQEMQELLKKLQAESAEKSEQIRKQEQKIKELEEQERKRLEAEDELAKLRAQIQILNKRLEDVEKDRDQALRDLAEANQRLIDRNRQLEKEQEARSKLNNVSEEADFWKKKYEKVRAKHKKEKAQIIELEEKIRKLEEKIRQLEENNQDRSEALLEIEELKTKHEAEFQDINKRKNNELESLRRELETTTRTYKEEIEKERRKNKATLDELEKEKARYAELAKSSNVSDDLLREIERLKKEIERLSNAGVVDPLQTELELILRELYFRKGRRTNLGNLEEQYAGDKALEDACIQAKYQVKTAIDQEKRMYAVSLPSHRKSEAEHERCLNELRANKAQLKATRNQWAKTYNSCGNNFTPKTEKEAKLEEWREKLVPIADDKARLNEQRDEVADWIDDVKDLLKEDDELFVRLEATKVARKSERESVTKNYSDSTQKLERFRVNEMERQDRLLRSAGDVDELTFVVVERFVKYYKEIFGKYENDTKNADVHQLVLKPVSWLSTYAMSTDNLLGKDNHKSSAVAQIKAYAYKGYNIDLSQVKDEFVIAEVLKGYFKDLTEPLLTWSLYEEFTVVGSDANEVNAVKNLRQSVARLPQLRRATLTVLIGFLRHLVENGKVNHSTPESVARVFGPLLLRSPFPADPKKANNKTATKTTAPAAPNSARRAALSSR